MLEDIPEPIPGPGEVRVAVRACGVNYPDLLIIQDLYQFKPPRPFAPGAEIAGVVDAVGAGVANVRVGDRVLLSPGAQRHGREGGGTRRQLLEDSGRHAVR